MNRRKKMTQIFKKKEKAKAAKSNPQKKPAYISKAEQAIVAAKKSND